MTRMIHTRTERIMVHQDDSHNKDVLTTSTVSAPQQRRRLRRSRSSSSLLSLHNNNNLAAAPGARIRNRAPTKSIFRQQQPQPQQQGAQSGNRRTRNAVHTVQWDDMCTVYEFPLMLGHHPSVSDGPPLTLSGHCTLCERRPLLIKKESSLVPLLSSGDRATQYVLPDPREWTRGSGTKHTHIYPCSCASCHFLLLVCCAWAIP